MLQLHYRNNTEATDPVELTILGCDVLCPYEDFIELQKDLIPTISIQDACKLDNKITETEDNYLE